VSEIRTQTIGPTNCRYYVRPGVKLNTTLITNTDPNLYSNPNPNRHRRLVPTLIQKLVKAYSCMNLGR